jgi:ADP-ribose pyrophosphatase
MEKSKDTWTVLSSEYLHRAPWLTVRKDHVVLPNGNHIPSYYILEYPNWVNTIAITRDGQFVFIRQYRHGIQETSYELCAGVCEEEDGSPMVSAQRELLEETGYGNGVWKEFMQISPNPSTHTNITYCFLAASSTEASVQADDFVGQPCPLCGKGTVIKGKTAYGCSEWKSGCTFRKPFE